MSPSDEEPSGRLGMPERSAVVTEKILTPARRSTQGPAASASETPRHTASSEPARRIRTMTRYSRRKLLRSGWKGSPDLMILFEATHVKQPS